MVGREVPPVPVVPGARRKNAPRLQHLKVGVVLHYDDPGLVPGLQDGLQHEEVVAVGVDREQVERLLDFEPLEDLDYVVRPEDDFLQPDVRVLVTSVQQQGLSYVPTFLLSRIYKFTKATVLPSLCVLTSSIWSYTPGNSQHRTPRRSCQSCSRSQTLSPATRPRRSAKTPSFPVNHHHHCRQ